MKYTPEQELAITRRGVSVSLSAGAGCGKTFVLTERFLSHLAPRANDGRPEHDLGSLVAITFTDRAAREMRDRIRRTTELRLQQAADETTARYWLHLKQQLETARISTIHSFCASVLRSHAVEARLDPRFTVLEPAQAATLEAELIDDELRRLLSGQDDRLVRLVVQFGLSRLRGMISALVEARHEIDIDAWRQISSDELVERWAAYHRDYYVPALLRGRMQDRVVRNVIELLEQYEPNHDVMRHRRQIVLEGLAGLCNSSRPMALSEEVREHARVQGASGKNVWPDPDVAAAVRDALQELRSFLTKLSLDLSFVAEEALPAAQAGLELLELSAGIVARYEQRKQEAALLDFDDLLARAARLLTAPENEALRRQVSAGVGLLLVDEFQDTDPQQVRLIEALCGEGLATGRLFFVGDHKQSIYRFRGADPRVFRELQNRMSAEGRLPLTRNFRSQPAILNFVNALFVDDLGPGYEPLQATRPQIAPEPAVEFLWAVPDESKSLVGERRRTEAEWIARRLRALLDSGQPMIWDQRADPTVCRPLRPGDIVLLFRAMSNVEQYEAALRKYGLDYYVVGGHAFYGQQEIFDVLNLLRALASTADGISLAGVLRSPFFSLSDESLMWLSQHPGGLTAGLFADELPVELEAEQRQRVAFAAGTLTELRAIKDRVPVATLLHEALARTGYDAALVAEFLGERKLANLCKLIDQARDFDQSGLFTLQDFIVQLDEFVSSQPKEAPAATQPAESQVVRLMTIHQAKGLEFPFVVVVDMARSQRRSSPGVAFDSQLGPLVQPRDPAADSRATTGYTMHQTLEQLEDDAELKRLLYVATTRAADYLLLSAGIDPADYASAPWLDELLARRFDLQTGELLAKLPAGWSVPRVRVTRDAPAVPSKGSDATRAPDLARVVEQALREKSSSPDTPLLATLDVDESARRQFSFSRLSGRLERPIGEPAEGDDQTPTGISPLDRRGLGTLVHAVLADLPFERRDALDVGRYVRKHASRHLAEDAPRELELATQMIGQFLTSDTAARLAVAQRRHAELEFLLSWPPGRRGAGGPYLQGYIDCLFQDPAGNWHLVDYKTNDVTSETVAAAAVAYELQMFVYGLAVERVVGEPPASSSLCFLRPGIVHAFSFSPPQRQRLIGLVDSALAGQNGGALASPVVG